VCVAGLLGVGSHVCEDQSSGRQCQQSEHAVAYKVRSAGLIFGIYDEFRLYVMEKE